MHNVRQLGTLQKVDTVTAMKVGKQIRVVSYYTPEAVERLDRLSAATRITKAVLLREALDDLLKKHTVLLRKGAK